ncbi:MAG TPA: polysaccharide deacetylase family protein [Bacteroidia bacterium]|jgi:peptidoglycan/xylan/chitin deacetylase (PgdA/CDA1 family)|nr:polysaccharide deacetylase family protein [Bacteroidia bacterium]
MRMLARPPALLRQLYPGALWRVKTNEKKIFLTFDDGPVPGVTTEVLSVLKQFGAQATFFCVGDNVRKHPEIFQQIISEGHRVGNHTFNHVDGWKQTKQQYLRQVNLCAENFQSEFFRPPYGRMRRSQFSAIKKKYKVVMWDVLTCDFDKDLSADEVLEIALKNSRAGSIVVFHDSEKAKDRMLKVLPEYLTEMKRRGFEFGEL